MSYKILPMTELTEPTGLRWWFREGIDQGAHFLVAYGLIILAGLLGATFTPGAGMLLGFAMGAVREVTEGGNQLSDGSLTDLGFWALGGFAGGLA